MEKPKQLLEQVPGQHQPKVIRNTQLRRVKKFKDRQEKIHSLAGAVRSNTYRIDCRKLADCLIAGLLLGIL